MAIEFVVEDGTGKSDATSYGSVADFIQYWINRGVDYGASLFAEHVVQVNLNVATEYIDQLYVWRGTKETTTQALEFPRYSCYDDTGLDQSGIVPKGIKYGTFLAARHLMDGNDLLTAVSNVRSKSMGPISVTYGFGGEQAVRLPQVEHAVASLVKPIGVLR